jgi:hypothetical protein
MMSIRRMPLDEAITQFGEITSIEYVQNAIQEDEYVELMTEVTKSVKGTLVVTDEGVFVDVDVDDEMIKTDAERHDDMIEGMHRKAQLAVEGGHYENYGQLFDAHDQTEFGGLAVMAICNRLNVSPSSDTNPIGDNQIEIIAQLCEKFNWDSEKVVDAFKLIDSSL